MFDNVHDLVTKQFCEEDHQTIPSVYIESNDYDTATLWLIISDVVYQS